MHRLTTVRIIVAIPTLAGILVFALLTLRLGLPQRMRREESGHAAIQLLDAMRRPFLEIKAAEARLLQTLDAEAGNRALATAVASASSVLGQYQKLAR